MLRIPTIAILGFLSLLLAQPAMACGTRVLLETHAGSQTAYSMAGSAATAAAALILLPGGGGHLALDESGCAQKSTGNSLVRMAPLFHDAGFVTALVGAPSDWQGKEGLGGFRIAAEHADDIGKVIADVRRRTALPVWLIGTSRGVISAVNAAGRLTGSAAPEGLILTSPVTSGREGAFKAWVAQTVFSTDLEPIRMPVLIVAHRDDKCVRTPPDRAGDIIKETSGKREQSVLVSGGPGWRGGVSVKACRGKAPHGFVAQEREVVSGIVRFIEGGQY